MWPSNDVPADFFFQYISCIYDRIYKLLNPFSNFPILQETARRESLGLQTISAGISLLSHTVFFSTWLPALEIFFLALWSVPKRSMYLGFFLHFLHTYLEKLKVRVVPEVPPIVTLLPISEVIPKKWWKLFNFFYTLHCWLISMMDCIKVKSQMIFLNVLCSTICCLMLELVRLKRNYA